MASVQFEHVEKTYPNGFRAITDLNLTVADGELMVFVGPSGCGKSTLLRLLAGLEEISRGRILIGGREVNRLTPQTRNIAMVFQDYALYPNMTVRGNLEFPLRMRKLAKSEIRRRAERVAAMLGLEELLERLPRQLSGGQRQRVAMGRALVREPTVFLLDEPLSNLDARLRVQVRAEIGDLQKRTGTTMIYVTHDQVEAMTLGWRIAVLNGGRIQQVASPKELYEQPANTFVAGFIGNPPMNLFPTRLSLDAQGAALIELGNQRLAAAPAGMAPESLRDCLDRPLIGGIRPEAFRLAIEGESGLLVESVVVEYLGHETLLHFIPADSPSAPRNGLMVARLAGMHVFQKGEKLRLCVAASDIALFSEDGRALETQRPAAPSA
jgi:multiple sugar transport system ATP-binding protein